MALCVGEKCERPQDGLEEVAFSLHQKKQLLQRHGFESSSKQRSKMKLVTVRLIIWTSAHQLIWTSAH